jgi:sarcosine oxidase subunit gamma
VSGEDAADVLNAGCPQDLSLAAFPVGAVSRTLFGKAEVVIFRVTEDTFRLECWRSFAEYVGGLLGEAVSEVIF